MSIPLDASEISEFTPAALRNAPAPPIFYFRPATERDSRQFWRLCKVEGLVLHTQEDIRAAIKAELRELWDQESYEREMPRLETLWATLDQNAMMPDADQIPLSEDELKAHNELMERLGQASRRLRTMAVDNEAFMSDAPKLALGLFLSGWRNVSVAFRREAGAVPLPVLDQLQTAITKLEQQAIADKVEGANFAGEAFLELSMHGFGLMNLTAATEGNSEPPSASPATPTYSRKARSHPRTAAGGSQGGARSRKTRAA